MSPESALATLADVPDDLYSSVATETGSWIPCWSK